MVAPPVTDSSPAPSPKPWPKVFALVLLGAIAVAAVPGYIAGGSWRWQQEASPKQLKALRQLPKTGIPIPGWQTREVSQRSLGGEQWLWQPIERQRPQTGQRDRAVLLLMPMKRGRDRPQVEWSALDSGNWLGNGLQTDSEQILTIRVPNLAPFRVRLLRLWTAQNQTYFLVSWYAWPDGGDPAPSQWFWRDRLAQWQHQHTPWAAASILMPADKPLDELDESYRARVTDLAAQVQTALLAGPLAARSTPPGR